MRYFLYEEVERQSGDGGSSVINDAPGAVPNGEDGVLPDTEINDPAGAVSNGDGEGGFVPNEDQIDSRNIRPINGANALSGDNIQLDVGHYDDRFSNPTSKINGLAINYEKPENYNTIKTYKDAEKEFNL